ncbi:MAG TPA: hypothetical protein VF475_16475 [Sphingobium sp.]
MTIIGLSIAAFTKLHVLISLIGIASGLWFLFGLLGGRWRGGTNGLFLATTILTTLTGFLFPITTLTPALIFGIISTAVLLVALVALYGFHLAGQWRTVYLASALFALYLNLFVLVVQSFQKIGALNRFAPTGTEPPFMVAQALTLLLFVYAAIRATRQRAL